MFGINTNISYKNSKKKEGKYKSSISVPKGEIFEIMSTQIKAHVDQARSYMSPFDFERLKNSIKAEGVHHPPIVWLEYDSIDPQKRVYQVVAGHRRVKAVRDLGINIIKVTVYKSIHLAKLAAVTTNELTENIHPIDKGIEYNSLLKIGTFQTARELAAYLGVDDSTVSMYLRYTIFPLEMRELIVKHDLRNRSFLAKMAKISKQVTKEASQKLWDEQQLEEHLFSVCGELISSEINKSIKKEKITNDENTRRESSQISNVLYLQNGIPAIRKNVVTRLSQQNKELLKLKIEELFGMLNNS